MATSRCIVAHLYIFAGLHLYSSMFGQPMDAHQTATTCVARRKKCASAGLGNGARVAAVVGGRCRGHVAGCCLLSYPLLVRHLSQTHGHLTLRHLEFACCSTVPMQAMPQALACCMACSTLLIDSVMCYRHRPGVYH